MAETGRLRTPRPERVRGVEASMRSLNSREKLLIRRREAIMGAMKALDSGDQEAFEKQLGKSKDLAKVIKEMEDFESIFLKAKTGQR